MRVEHGDVCAELQRLEVSPLNTLSNGDAPELNGSSDSMLALET